MHDIKEMNDIIRCIVEYYNENFSQEIRFKFRGKIKFSAIFGKSRHRTLAEIRFLFLHFARMKYDARLFSNSFIARYINRTHTAVNHANKTINELLAMDKNFQIIYNDLKNKI
jgi:chromosomal replication initiation ATPase DnaA